MPLLFHGGAETQFRRLSIGLVRRGFKVTIWTLQSISPDHRELFSNNNIRIKIISFDLLKYQQSSLKHFIYTLAYVRLTFQFFMSLLEWRPHVLISYGMLLAPFIPLFKLFGVKVIFSCRTATKILTRRKYLGWFYNCADYVTTNTYRTCNYLHLIGVKSSKLTIINNGVELNDEPKLSIARPIRSIYLIGRVHPIKNHLYLLKSLCNALQYDIYFVGPFSDVRYYGQLVEHIRVHGMDDRVHFHGYEHDIESVYRKADVIVMPSHEEGVSNVILECFKYGKLCVASNIAANCDLLNGRGFLIDISDESSLVRALEEISVRRMDDLETMVKRNYHYLVKNHNISQSIQGYTELIFV